MTYKEMTNVTGDSSSMAMPATAKKNCKYSEFPILKKYKVFEICSDTFRKFETGKTKFERWSKYLNLEDDAQRQLYDYAKTNLARNLIILKDSTTGAMRAIRRRSADGR